ncbi:MAG: hypothetical protein WCB46_08590 [Methanoregula sp.]
MDTGPAKKLIALFLGILLAFFIANMLSHAIVMLSGLAGAAAMIVSMVVYAVIFFFVLHFLQKYAHIVFFGFGRE